jgi:ElaB/YqjD/DUF883 family membrane-anchored ribosome-binding protein
MSHSATCETIEEAVEQAGAKARDAQDAVGQWVHRAQENLHSVKDAASTCVSRGQEKFGELNRTVSSQVKERPVAALLAAAGFGFLLGMVLKRR